MKSQQALVDKRYLYTPSDPIRKTQTYTQYKAYDKVTKKQFLLQINENPDILIDSLKKEKKHPFILFVFDRVEMNDGRVSYLFQSGSIANLEEALNKVNYLNEEDALVIFKFIILMVKELHDKNIILGRICLENIILCNYSLVKLGHNVFTEDLLQQYMSPQILKNGGKWTPNDDIYSLGVLLYKLLYGQFPFAAESPNQLIKKIKSKKFENIESNSPLEIVISRQVHFLVQSMLEFYPDNRPDLDTILANPCFAFQIETELQRYVKPKGSIIPESFHRKYLVFRPSKIITKYGDYSSEAAYLIFHKQQKKFMTMYAPQIKMFEAEPRKIESFYEKIKVLIRNKRGKDNEFLLKIDDIDTFRQEPLIATEYCNQGNLKTYLEKRKISKGWISQKQINVLMYILAVAMKQMKAQKISSIHTMNNQRIMISNQNIKIRQPGLLTPIVEKKLQQSLEIDFFAPELKEKMDYVELDKSDMWSYGVTYYWLLTGEMPKLNQENQIELNDLKTNKKNINIVGRCLDYNVKKRMELENIKLENVDDYILQSMLMVNKFKGRGESQSQIYEEENIDINEMMERSDLDSNAQEIRNNKKVMFKRRKKRLFKNYNKIISQSTTSPCRLYVKAIYGLVVLWAIFFSTFFQNGGVGLLRTNFFRKITLQVPTNYGTSLTNMTILSTNGATIQQDYHEYSYEQFTRDLRCAQNSYSQNSQGQIFDFINNTQSVYCLFGFVWAILISVLYAIVTLRLDLPTIMLKYKENQDIKTLYHFAFMNLMLPSMLFTFFYIFAFEYIVQYSPCLGIENLAYPKFTSVQSILNQDLATFFSQVFLTVGVWGIAMLIYGYTSFFIKRVSANIFEWKVIGPAAGIMTFFTLLCRMGFGASAPIEPTWSYEMNLDITSTYYGLFGFFPELLWIVIVLGEILIDFLFWFFLKLGLDPVEQEDITKIEVVRAKFQRINTKQNQKIDNTNIYMIENAYDFQRFQ